MRKNQTEFKFAKPEQSPGFLLWQVSNLWQKSIRQALQTSGLTHNQFVLLAGLLWHQNNEKSLSQKALASFTKLDPMVTSSVVRQLEDKKLLTRIKSDQDQRALFLRLTGSGLRLIKAAIPVVEEVDELFFASVEGQESDLIAHLKQLLIT